MRTEIKGAMAAAVFAGATLIARDGAAYRNFNPNTATSPTGISQNIEDFLGDSFSGGEEAEAAGPQAPFSAQLPCPLNEPIVYVPSYDRKSHAYLGAVPMCGDRAERLVEGKKLNPAKVYTPTTQPVGHGGSATFLGGRSK